MTQFYLRQINHSKVTSKLKSLFKNNASNGIKFGFLLLIGMFIMKNDMSFQFHLNSIEDEIADTMATDNFAIFQPFTNLFESKTATKKKDEYKALKDINDENLSNDYSNMTYQSKTKKVSVLSSSSTSKIERQRAYVKRFADVARSEMRKFGIPASITLAQGLIESNAGDSRLSTENNNHFGMKCFSKKCKNGHCSNFTDDSHKDFFRNYATAWESFRAHSIMLGGDRYKHLKKLKKSDYKGWSIGLKKAGYATDKRYAEKLIHIIEELGLSQYDN